MIYNLDGTEQPVIKYTNPPSVNIDFAFMAKGENDLFYIIIKQGGKTGYKYPYLHYEIKWKRPDVLIIDEESSKEHVKIITRFCFSYKRL